MPTVTTENSVTSVWTEVQNLAGGNGKEEREKETLFQKILSLLRRRMGRLMSLSHSIDGGELGNICNEELFKYLLASERIRSERSGSSFQLLLVMLMTAEGGALVQIDDIVARSLFSVLRHSLRGTDYTGWYQDQFVIGAVLTAMGGREVEEISKQVERRFLQASQERLSGNDWGKLRVRICRQSEVETGQVFL